MCAEGNKKKVAQQINDQLRAEITKRAAAGGQTSSLVGYIKKGNKWTDDKIPLEMQKTAERNALKETSKASNRNRDLDKREPVIAGFHNFHARHANEVAIE